MADLNEDSDSDGPRLTTTFNDEVNLLPLFFPATNSLPKPDAKSRKSVSVKEMEPESAAARAFKDALLQSFKELQAKRSAEVCKVHFCLS